MLDRESIVYKAEVTSTVRQTYVRHNMQKSFESLCNEKYKHEAKLSKHFWNLEKENRQFSIRWAIVKQLPAGRNGKRNCALCIEEKPMIMKGRSKNIINGRSQMLSNLSSILGDHLT